MRSIDDVLQQVARGELAPDEALALLAGTGAGAEEVDTDPPAYVPPPPGATPEPEGQAAGRSVRGVRSVRVRTLARSLEIFADPAVAEVQVTSGSPTLRLEGDTLVVEPRTGGPHGPGARYAFVRSVAALPGLDERLVLRVNPALLLDVDVSAVSLRIWGCEGGLRLRLAASSAKLDRVAGPLTIESHSSSVKGTTRLSGESSIRCESSSIKLALLEGSDVTIRSSNRMGKVVLPRRRTKTAGEARAVSRVGAGRGLLTVDATMSSVTLGRDL